MIPVLYVDHGLILIGINPKILTHVKFNLKKKFEMIVLGTLHYFLGLQVLQTQEWIFIYQFKYACDLLRFHMEDRKPTLSSFQYRTKLYAIHITLEVVATL